MDQLNMKFPSVIVIDLFNNLTENEAHSTMRHPFPPSIVI